jgi:hypothetical protein
MAERSAAQQRQARSELDDYIRSTAGSGTSSADELTRLADLRDKGTITEAEFQTMKARVVGGSGTGTTSGTATGTTTTETTATGTMTDTATGHGNDTQR